MDQSEGGIYLPEPEGYKRAQITFKGGIAITVDASMAELLTAVEEFLAGKDRFLRVVDAQYGEPAYISRAAVEEALVIGTTWVTNLRPRANANGKVVLPAKFA